VRWFDAVKARPMTKALAGRFRQQPRRATGSPLVLTGAVDALRAAGLLALLLAVGLGALMVVVFNWEGLDVLYGTALGVLMWGGGSWFVEVRQEVPSTETLPLSPAGAKIDRPLSLPRVVLMLPVFVGLAWFADRFDLGAVFVPGQLAGLAVAKLVGAVLVRRWERAHGTQVFLRRGDSGEPELYASRPCAAAGTRRVRATTPEIP
jgi:hypothetical protein